jgi:hypothetical protein
MSTGPDWDDTTLTSDISPRSRAAAEAGRGTSWVLFAGIMLATVALLNVIWGLAALAKSGFFVADASYILLTDLRAWGWIALALGALEFLAAFSIWRGEAFGRWFGIAVAVVSIVGALMSMPASPLWSLTVVALGILVIYGLAVYGGRPELTA